MKKKIIVYGLGKDFEKYYKKICEVYEVIGVTDKIYMEIDNYIKPEELNLYKYDCIFICSRKYCDSIMYDLIEKYEIPIEKIEGLMQFIEVYEKKKLGFQKVLRDIKLYNSLNQIENFLINTKDLNICYSDYDNNAGVPETHYFAQDIWAAKKIYENNPREHYDIGSSLNGFIAHLLVFRKVNYIDVRPLPYNIPNLNFIQADATTLDNIGDNSIESLSSLHAIEHFGLGRYGDNVDPSACFTGMKNIVRVVKPGGKIYIGVPIGNKDKLVFNAHRIFKIDTVLKSMSNKVDLLSLEIVRPFGTSEEKISKNDWDSVEEYSCGLFEFKKKE